MTLKLFMAQSVRRLHAGCARLQKLDIKRVGFLVIVAAFGSLSLLFFQNFTNPPPQPLPPPNYVKKPNYKFFQYGGYPIPYVPRGNPKPMSPQVAADNYLKQKAVSMASRKQLTQDTTCSTVAITYKDKDPKTNLAMRTLTFVCGSVDWRGNYSTVVLTQNDIFDRGPNGSPGPVGQVFIKTPVTIANVAAAKQK